MSPFPTAQLLPLLIHLISDLSLMYYIHPLCNPFEMNPHSLSRLDAILSESRWHCHWTRRRPNPGPKGWFSLSCVRWKAGSVIKGPISMLWWATFACTNPPIPASRGEGPFFGKRSILDALLAKSSPVLSKTANKTRSRWDPYSALSLKKFIFEVLERFARSKEEVSEHRVLMVLHRIEKFFCMFWLQYICLSAGSARNLASKASL